MRSVSFCVLFALAASLVAAQSCVAPSTNVFDGSSGCPIANLCRSALCACTGSTAAFPGCLSTNTKSCSSLTSCLASYASCLMLTTATRMNTSDPCSTFGNNLYISQLAAAATTTFNTTNLAQSCAYSVCTLANATGNTAGCDGKNVTLAVCSPSNLLATQPVPTTGNNTNGTTTVTVFDITFTIRISGSSWTIILANTSATTQAAQALAADIAALFGIDVQFIVIQSLASGSLIANVGVKQGSGKTPATLQTAILAAQNTGAWLKSLQSVYSTVSNETLTALSVTVTATGAPSSPSGPGTTAPTPGTAAPQTPAPTSSAVSAAGVWAVAAVAAVAALWA